MKKMTRWMFTMGLLLATNSAVLAESNPAILFCSPQGVTGGWTDLTSIRELHEKGFAVDYTDTLTDITWERIQRYNVLALHTTPDAFAVAMQNQPTSKEKTTAFVELIERYVRAGGGVFLMPMEQNIKKQHLSDLTSRWGATLPIETIKESDTAKVAFLDNASYQVPIAFTDQVLESPVSAGVKQIWYPIQPAYNAAHGGPLDVDANWQVVVKGSPTSVSVPVDLSKTGFAPSGGVVQRAGGVKEPALFAIRQYQAGRIALINQWPQYSIGSGVKWIYDRQVLSRGAAGKPSDFGKLLENTFRWLAEPSLAHGAGVEPGPPTGHLEGRVPPRPKADRVGGYVTKEETLIAPNRRDAARKMFEYTFWYWEYEVAQWHRPPKFAPILRGVIGAKSAYSSGKGTVKEFADAAKQAGLDFIVFLEDFDKLTAEEYQQLQQDCQTFSDDQVTLIPGFTIDANTGDHMFFFGIDRPWPAANALTGPNKALFDLQPQDKDGKFTGYNGDSFNWLFEYHGDQGNVGYYNFTSSPSNMRVTDLRCYGMAALRYYKDGKLVEDMTDDYLRCAYGTIPPAPAVFNEVRSPDELIREAKSGHALTCVQARSVKTVMQDGLWWPNQYQSNNIFPSDGPLIHDWPATIRVMTLGAEEFVTLPAVMVSHIDVSAERGLKEIAIYNGRELYRRFALNGEKKFTETLLLNATIHRTLVLIATDAKGGRAVSFARRAWKEGGRDVSFCSDHVNDCKSGGWLLAHGPAPMIAHWVVPLPDDIAGATWDGGPPASLPLVGFQETRPQIDTDKGQETGTRFNQTPVMEYGDEGAVAVATVQDEVFSDQLLNVVNPWHTFGPRGGPSKLIEYTLRYREYHTPTVGVPEAGWAGPGVREGINACLFRGEITFKDSYTIQDLMLMSNSLVPKVAPVYFAHGHAPAAVAEVLELSKPGMSASLTLAPGDWFALFSPKIASGHIFIVREQPLQLAVSNPGHIIIRADLAGKEVKKGDAYAYELFSMGVPINIDLRKIEDVTRRLTYLAEPTAMKILRGKRAASPGFIEVAPDNGAVEVSVPKPAEKTDLTLPLRVTGLNRRWTAGLFQKKGYVKGDYGTGENRFRELGVDLSGNAYVPLYVDKADETHMVAGHPAVADAAGKDLFIQVTHVYENPDQWHVAVNNPTDKPIKTTLRKAMDLPGFDFRDKSVTVKPGEYMVLQ